jgi:hypothetical protein
MSERLTIRDDSDNLDPIMLDLLLSSMSSAASVYHKPPEVREQINHTIGLLYFDFPLLSFAGIFSQNSGCR